MKDVSCTHRLLLARTRRLHPAVLEGGGQYVQYFFFTTDKEDKKIIIFFFPLSRRHSPPRQSESQPALLPSCTPFCNGTCCYTSVDPNRMYLVKPGCLKFSTYVPKLPPLSKKNTLTPPLPPPPLVGEKAGDHSNRQGHSDRDCHFKHKDHDHHYHSY